jgi:thiol-disulfide isomerase/thioredoxin
MSRRTAIAIFLPLLVMTMIVRGKDNAVTKPSTQPVRHVTIETLEASRGGQELIGQPMPELNFSRWLGTDANKPLETAGSVTLYRWWTDTCPYCEATLPALETLRKKYEGKGLKVVAVYHPKPPRKVEDQIVAKAADERGYHGAVALDEDWGQLKKAWLSPGRRAATSVSFLVDDKGVIRFVHPGVMYFPSEKQEEAQENRDYVLLDRAIDALLAK